MKYSSLPAQGVVKMTTSCATSKENCIKKTFPFQWFIQNMLRNSNIFRKSISIWSRHPQDFVHVVPDQGPSEHVRVASPNRTAIVFYRFAVCPALIAMVESRRPFHWRVFIHDSNTVEIYFCFHPNFSVLIATTFCTCHGSCAVVACAKSCSDRTHCNRQFVIWRFFFNRWLHSKLS